MSQHSANHNSSDSDVPPLHVPLIDVKQQNVELGTEIKSAIDEVCESCQFVLGPQVTQLEESIAEYCDADFAIGCGSGSDALILALMAANIGPDDEVILPSFTFFATAGAVSLVGGTPIFVDIDPNSYLIDPSKIEEKITDQTKAIIPVHLFGQCVEMEPIWRIAVKHNLRVIEDAAQAIGAEYRGRRAGVLGDVGCFSFYPTKNLGAFGDGGMITTNDAELADRIQLLRVHGMRPRYYHKVVGMNSRLDSIQAAVLNVKLPHLDKWTEQRTANANRYHQLFAKFGLTNELELPLAFAERRHVWNQYIVRVKNGHRDDLRAYLAENNVGSEIYYPVPAHDQECFAELESSKVSLPLTDAAALGTIALPIFPELTTLQQQHVVETIHRFYAEKASAKSNVKQPNFAKQAKKRV